MENNLVSGSVPPSLVECMALTSLFRGLKSNLLSGSLPSEWHGHAGADQRYAVLDDDGIRLPAARIPLNQRLRVFQVAVPAIDEVSQPSMLEFEARDACLYSPNALFRCSEPGREHPGASVEHHYSGGLRRCEQTFTQPSFPGYNLRATLSGEYNHRTVAGGDTQTPLIAQIPGGHWTRAPFPHEAAEHVTPLGDGSAAS
jgi:hypothetical protein